MLLVVDIMMSDVAGSCIDGLDGMNEKNEAGSCLSARVASSIRVAMMSIFLCIKFV